MDHASWYADVLQSACATSIGWERPSMNIAERWRNRRIGNDYALAMERAAKSAWNAAYRAGRPAEQSFYDGVRAAVRDSQTSPNAHFAQAELQFERGYRAAWALLLLAKSGGNRRSLAVLPSYTTSEQAR